MKKLWNRRVFKNLSVRIKENVYETMWRCDITLITLNKINSKYSKKCWRCNIELGTYLHLWWGCEVIQKMWREVFKVIREILEIDTVASSRTALLLLIIMA